MIVLTGEGPRPSAPAATSASAATPATSPTTRRQRSGASTSPTCTSRCAACPSRSWRWWPATRSAAATCCTWSATSRSPPTTPASGRPARGWAASTAASAPALLAAQVGPKKAREIWFLCRQYDAGRGAGDGPREHRRAARGAGGGDGALVPRDAGHSPPSRCDCSRPASTRTRTGWPAIQQLAHDANLLFYMTEEAQEGTQRLPARSARPTSRSSRAGREPPAPLAPGRQAADPPRGDRAGAGGHVAGDRRTGHASGRSRFVAALVGSVFIQIGTNLSNDYSDARRGADTEDRLGPVRVTAGGLLPPRRVLVGTYLAFGVAVAAGAYLAAVAGWQLLVVGAASIAGRRALHRRAAPVRLRGPRRAVRVPLLRRRGGDRLLLRADRAARRGRRSPSRCRWACWPRRSWW